MVVGWPGLLLLLTTLEIVKNKIIRLTERGVSCRGTLVTATSLTRAQREDEA